VKLALFHRLDRTARNLIPVALTVLLVFVGVLHWPLPGFSTIAPMLPLMAIYYWAIYRPDLVPAYAVFFVGLLLDLLDGGPLGVHALVFLLVFGTMTSQRRFFLGKPFFVVWLGFVLVGVGASVVSWALISLLLHKGVAVWPVLFQLVLTLALYPFVSWLFIRIQRDFLGRV
jgi:rod shape-determining protein MreD